MANTYLELDVSMVKWESDKAYGVDYPLGATPSARNILDSRDGLTKRVFFPKSVAKVTDDGGILIPVWLIEKKVREVPVDPYLAFGNVKHDFEDPASANKVVDASNILAMFDKAAESIKYPKVQFTDVKVSRSGARAKEPFALNVTDYGRYPNNEWYGRIGRDGKFVPSRKATPEVIDLIEKFDADPAGFAGDHGRTSGACAFCGRELTDDRSKIVGIGPVCAKKFNLPWGSAATKKAEAA